MPSFRSPSTIRIEGETAVICLQDGLEAQIDTRDVFLVSKRRWRARNTKLGRKDVCTGQTRDRSFITLHRYLERPADSRLEVVHKDGDGLNNRRSNLRCATRTQDASDTSRIKGRLLAKISTDDLTGCWSWTGPKIDGYGCISLGRTTKRCHRLSYEIHCGPIPKEVHVLHRCDNRACVNPDHLFLGTNADNIADKVAKGRQQRLAGTANGNTKLTDAEVLAIRAMIGILPQRTLAKQYGVSHGLIAHICSGKAWAHLL